MRSTNVSCALKWIYKALQPAERAKFHCYLYHDQRRLSQHRHGEKKLLEVVDFCNEKFREKMAKGKRSAGKLKKWKSTRDKLSAYMKHVHKRPDIQLE